MQIENFTFLGRDIRKVKNKAFGLCVDKIKAAREAPLNIL
jgi:hypothetical protein